jgi:hypothetical protein
MEALDDLKYSLRHKVINKAKFYSHYPKYRMGYGRTLPNFYSTITVNPAEIERFVYPAFFRDGRFPRFEGNDWDKNKYSGNIRSYSNKKTRGTFSIANYDVYQSICARYKKGRAWKDTQYYTVAMENIDEGETWHDCDSERELMSWLSSLDDLYYDMKYNGYKSATELGKHISQEVTIDVGRSGELLMDDGRHRLFLSKILGIDEIPVWILVRHRLWQKKRCDIALSGRVPPQEMTDHPDLQSIA